MGLWRREMKRGKVVFKYGEAGLDGMKWNSCDDRTMEARVRCLLIYGTLCATYIARRFTPLYSVLLMAAVTAVRSLMTSLAFGCEAAGAMTLNQPSTVFVVSLCQMCRPSGVSLCDDSGVRCIGCIGCVGCQICQLYHTYHLCKYCSSSVLSL